MGETGCDIWGKGGESLTCLSETDTWSFGLMTSTSSVGASSDLCAGCRCASTRARTEKRRSKGCSNVSTRPSDVCSSRQMVTSSAEMSLRKRLLAPSSSTKPFRHRRRPSDPLCPPPPIASSAPPPSAPPPSASSPPSVPPSVSRCVLRCADSALSPRRATDATARPSTSLKTRLSIWMDTLSSAWRRQKQKKKDNRIGVIS